MVILRSGSAKNAGSAGRTVSRLLLWQPLHSPMLMRGFI
jgi:hypothetical protein